MSFDYIVDKVVDLGLELLKDKIKTLLSKEKLKKKATDYLSQMNNHAGLAFLEDEYDFSGLMDYIKKSWSAPFMEYVDAVGEEREKIKKTMVEEAIKASSPQNSAAVDQVKALIKNILKIYYDFYRQEAPVHERLLYGEAISTFLEEEEKTRKEIQEIKKNQIKKNKTVSDFNLEDYLENQKEIVLNYSIFPWFSNSKRYREVFPSLFIFPKLKERGNDIQFSDILENCSHHIAILGEAGAGKSTLLRYVFLFERTENRRFVFLTAKDTMRRPALLKRINNASSDQHSIVLVDGIDEAFYESPEKYCNFIGQLKTYDNCRFWLGCRSDYYKRFYNEETMLSNYDVEIQPWDENQGDAFIKQYSEIVKNSSIPYSVEKLVSNNASMIKMKSNPFQLALLVYLAENSEDNPIKGIYDLYEKFITSWIVKEQERGTSNESSQDILKCLTQAARTIYKGSTWTLDQVATSNSAVSDLLKKKSINGKTIAYEFYHRSITAFLIAKNVFQAFENSNYKTLKSLLKVKLKDDVTNFIGAKFVTLLPDERKKLKSKLERMYYKSSNSDLSVQEQLVYFISRLEIDVSDFLKMVVTNNSENPIMRLTLAYGCVLSDDQTLRDFALDYAKSIANGGIDASTNRGWTVVYFGDVIDKDPYVYLDDEKKPWTKAREARIKRFAKEAPRLKDVRFWLFDIPLFRSFLEDRNWDNLSSEELEVIKSLNISKDYFNEQEIIFLTDEKQKLICEYENNLLAKSID